MPSVLSNLRSGASPDRHRMPYHSLHRILVTELASTTPLHPGQRGYSRKVSKKLRKVHRLASGKQIGELNHSLADDLLVVFQRSRAEPSRPRPASLSVFSVIVDAGHCECWSVECPSLPIYKWEISGGWGHPNHHYARFPLPHPPGPRSGVIAETSLSIISFGPNVVVGFERVRFFKAKPDVPTRTTSPYFL